MTGKIIKEKGKKRGDTNCRPSSPPSQENSMHDSAQFFQELRIGIKHYLLILTQMRANSCRTFLYSLKWTYIIIHSQKSVTGAMQACSTSYYPQQQQASLISRPRTAVGTMLTDSPLYTKRQKSTMIIDNFWTWNSNSFLFPTMLGQDSSSPPSNMFQQSA
jgi:hypothetical protein